MKKYLFLFITATMLVFSLFSLTASATPPLLVDSAGLLSDEEHAALLSVLEEIQTSRQFDVVILTVDSIGDQSPMAYADDYYDQNGYGYGENHDGCLLLLAMQSRDWWISTTGYGITAFTDAGIDYISDCFLPYLGNGEYYEGFSCFAGLCDAFIEQANTGSPYDIDDLINDYDDTVEDQPFQVLRPLAISLSIGLIVAFIITMAWKSQLKPVKFQNLAHEYLKKDSMKVTLNRDIFLYSTVSKTRIERDSGSSGGSSTHSSSSGTSHGGGGGKF